MAAVASKNLTIRFIADVSKWKPQLDALKKDLNDISKMKVSPDFKIPNMPGVMRSPGASGSKPNIPSLGSSSGKGGGDLSSISEQLSLGGMDKASDILDLASRFKALASPIAIAAAAVTGFTIAMAKTIEVGNQTRNSIVQFKTLLGGTDAEEKALDLFTRVKECGGTTPLELPQLTNATSQLLGVGVASDDVIKKMSMLGDISLVTGKDFNELTDIYAKNKSTGLVQLGDLTQIANAKIPVFGVLAKQMGVTEMQIMQMASANKILFKDLDKAFQTMTDSGGLFYKGMENMAKEIPGSLSNISDSWDDIWRAISGADKGAKATSFWNYLTGIIFDFAQYFGSFVALIRPLLFDMGTLIGSVFMAVWDFGKMLWTIFEPLINVLFVYWYGVMKATFFILTTAFQTLSKIFNAIAWTFSTIYSVVVWIIQLLYKIPFIAAPIDMIGESIFRLINWLQNVWIKFITIFAASMLYISLMIDLIKNADWVKIGDNIYKSITKSFDAAWSYIKTTSLYKFLEKIFQGDLLKDLKAGLTDIKIKADDVLPNGFIDNGIDIAKKVIKGVSDGVSDAARIAPDAYKYINDDNKEQPLKKEEKKKGFFAELLDDGEKFLKGNQAKSSPHYVDARVDASKTTIIMQGGTIAKKRTDGAPISSRALNKDAQ